MSKKGLTLIVFGVLLLLAFAFLGGCRKTGEGALHELRPRFLDRERIRPDPSATPSGPLGECKDDNDCYAKYSLYYRCDKNDERIIERLYCDKTGHEAKWKCKYKYHSSCGTGLKCVQSGGYTICQVTCTKPEDCPTYGESGCKDNKVWTVACPEGACERLGLMVENCGSEKVCVEYSEDGKRKARCNPKAKTGVYSKYSTATTGGYQSTLSPSRCTQDKDCQPRYTCSSDSLRVYRSYCDQSGSEEDWKCETVYYGNCRSGTTCIAGEYAKCR